MRCAIYARKSTDDQEQSTKTQVAQATAYIARKGWVLLEDHLYIDDGISGAEYVNRPSFFNLLNSAKEFDAVVMSEPSRFGRDMTRNAYFMQELIESDCRVFYYHTDSEELCETPEQKLLINFKSYASEQERLRNAQRVHDAFALKFQQGHVVGGVVYGYDNIPVYSDGVDNTGKRKRLYVKYEVNEDQANVVRRIFTMFRDGYTINGIARALNEDGIPSPTKGRGSWSPSTIRTMLTNERYAGVLVWNKWEKLYRRGTKVRRQRPETDWLRLEMSDLRIVDVRLWQDVQARLREVRASYLRSVGGKLLSRPERTQPTSLLSSLGKCSECGGSIVAVSKRATKKGPVRYYGCLRRSNRGGRVCDNHLTGRVDKIDSMFLEALEREVVNEAVFTHVTQQAIEIIKAELKHDPTRLQEFNREQRKLEREIRNLTRALAGGYSDILADEVRNREDRLKALNAEIERLEDGPKVIPLMLKQIERDVGKKVRNFSNLLQGNLPVARQALKKLFPDGLTFTPVENEGRRFYEVRGNALPLVTFEQERSIKLASPGGFEPPSPA